MQLLCLFLGRSELKIFIQGRAVVECLVDKRRLKCALRQLIFMTRCEQESEEVLEEKHTFVRVWVKAFTQTCWASSHWGQECPNGAGQGIFQSNPRQGWKVHACASFSSLVPLCLTPSCFHPSASAHCEHWGW